MIPVYYTARMVASTLITSLAAFCPIRSSAQERTTPDSAGKKDSATAPTTTDPLGTWFKQRGFSIRKTFDGSRDEQNPASIFFAREPTGKDDEFTVIDLAIKLSETDLLARHPSRSLIVSPVVEYHRSTNTAKLVNKASGTARAEWQPWGLRTPATDSNPGTWRGWAPVLITDAKFSRDWGSNTNEVRYGARASFTVLRSGWPGATIRSASGAFRARYYPYVGVDYYRFASQGHDTVGTVAYGRIFLEYTPFASSTQEFVQLTLDASSRHALGKNPELPRQLSDAVVAANFWFDGHGHIGIGLEYANGRDATLRFARRERTSIAIKVKF